MSPAIRYRISTLFFAVSLICMSLGWFYAYVQHRVEIVRIESAHQQRIERGIFATYYAAKAHNAICAAKELTERKLPMNAVIEARLCLAVIETWRFSDEIDEFKDFTLCSSSHYLTRHCLEELGCRDTEDFFEVASKYLVHTEVNDRQSNELKLLEGYVQTCLKNTIPPFIDY